MVWDTCHPGGSYRRVVLDKEGSALAPFFNARGYTLFVMTYRLPGDGHEEASNAPLADAQRAMRYIRANAHEWKINPDRIGVLGFLRWSRGRQPGNTVCRNGLYADR
jgi:acetyl esterase/lipase